MAITQDRMLALVFAASDYKNAYERLRKFAMQQAKDANDGIISHKDALANIALSADVSAMLQRPVDSATTIILESKHFTAGKIRENKKRAEKEAARRRIKGIPERHQLPRPNPDDYGVIRLVPEHHTAPRHAPAAGYDVDNSFARDMAELAALQEKYDAEDIQPEVEPDDPSGADLNDLL